MEDRGEHPTWGKAITYMYILSVMCTPLTY